MGFAGLDSTSYARTELSRKRNSEGGISLPDRVEATMAVLMYMTTLATDDDTRMGREEIGRVGTQWGKQFQRVKGGINLFVVTNKSVEQTEAF